MGRFNDVLKLNESMHTHTIINYLWDNLLLNYSHNPSSTLEDSE